MHWKSAGYDSLPDRLNDAEIRRQKESSVVAEIANALIEKNPAKSDAVLSYINESVIPFITGHRTQFECLLSEHYYNLTGVPTDGLADFAESPLMFRFDLAYLLLNTQDARWNAEIALPDSETWQSALAYVQEHGWTDPSNKIHFDCAA